MTTELAYPVKTVADFPVGTPVTVIADQGYRQGRVTKIGRTRLTVEHPRNKKGDLAERPYSLKVVVVGQTRRGRDWWLVMATGDLAPRYSERGAYGGWQAPTTPLPAVPVLEAL